jgi:L-threonylcarbamoyladenylate synthase
MTPEYRKGLISRPHPPALLMAVDIIRKGGLVIAPTDTFYAILGDVWSQRAVTRLVKMKSRDYGKPIPLIAGSSRITRNFVEDIPPIFNHLAREFWPGPLIMVLKAARGLPVGITAGTGSVGVRVPQWCVGRELITLLGRPLMATGATMDGWRPPRAVGDIPRSVRSSVDLILDGGWTPGYQPPTVVNLVPDSPVIVREGTVGSRLSSFLNDMSWEGAGTWRSVLSDTVEV